MKRLAVIHTVLFLADLFKKKLSERYPDLESFHVVDESLLRDLLQAGGLTPNIIRRVATQAGLARDAGAEAILFTCSSTSPAVDVVRPMLDIPILKIDDPMAEKAVRLGRKVGVVCTASSTPEASKNLVIAHAVKQGKEVEVVVRLESEAFEAVMRGDKARHDQLVGDAVVDLSKETDVVVLAQASMAHLAPALNESSSVPVLASPELCVDALADFLRD
ncbi:MAG: aspartate/glutamate racemase family protein [Desulfobacteraceae bacterium]|jgi:Asp/Glu/hydantoin racemase